MQSANVVILMLIPKIQSMKVCILSTGKTIADLEFSRLKSWSRDLFLQVLVSVLVLNLGVWVLVLVSLSLGLGLGLGTVFIARKSLVRLPSAPVEWIHSGLLMRANRARMDDNMLSQLVYLRCNNKL